MRTRTRILAALSLPAVLAPGGCIVSSSNSERIDGAYIQPENLREVKVNLSDKEDVLEALSEPSTRTKDLDAGTETWTWNWTRRKKGQGAVLLVFAGSSESQISESVHVMFDDRGIVIDKWRD